MPHIKPEGSFVALITPFNNDGSVDIEGFRTLLDFHQENGTRAVLIMGSTGEVSMLSTDERKHILEETMKFHNGGMLFYYGCTGQNTETTKDFIHHACIHGADGAIIAAPAYICASNADIVDFSYLFVKGEKSCNRCIYKLKRGSGHVKSNEKSM